MGSGEQQAPPKAADDNELPDGVPVGVISFEERLRASRLAGKSPAAPSPSVQRRVNATTQAEVRTGSVYVM